MWLQVRYPASSLSPYRGSLLVLLIPLVIIRKLFEVHVNRTANELSDVIPAVYFPPEVA